MSRSPEQAARHRERMRAHRASDPARARAIARRYRERNSEKVAARKAAARVKYEALKASPCTDCGGTFPPECMDWDHVRGEKVKGLGSMGSHVGPALLAEIDKCDLVCSNCHRIRTRRRLVLPSL